MAKRNDLKALYKLLVEAHDVLRTTFLPEGRSERVYDLLTAAVSLSEALLEESPAAVLGAKGGKQTAKLSACLLLWREYSSKEKPAEDGGGISLLIRSGGAVELGALDISYLTKIPTIVKRIRVLRVPVPSWYTDDELRRIAARVDAHRTSLKNSFLNSGQAAPAPE